MHGGENNFSNLRSDRRMVESFERDLYAKRGSIATVCIDLLVSIAGDGFCATADDVGLSDDEDCLAFTLFVPRSEDLVSLINRWRKEAGVKEVGFSTTENAGCIRCTVTGMRSVYNAFMARQERLRNRPTNSIKSSIFAVLVILLVALYLVSSNRT